MSYSSKPQVLRLDVERHVPAARPAAAGGPASPTSITKRRPARDAPRRSGRPPPGRLRRHVHDRVEDEVRERESALHPRRREVADRDADVLRRRASTRSRLTIAFDMSMPWTGTPRSRSGTAIRPVPIASSSARPLPPARARKSTVALMTSCSNSGPFESSYRRATRSSKYPSSFMRRGYANRSLKGRRLAVWACDAPEVRTGPSARTPAHRGRPGSRR